MRQGDLVIRKSYGGDIVFKIQELRRQQAVLRGVEMRLLADAPLYDLDIIRETDFTAYNHAPEPRWIHSMRRWTQREPATGQTSASSAQEKPAASKEVIRAAYFDMPGKVLHLDGDPSYLRKCMSLYGELKVPAEGYYVPEANMADALYRLLPQIRPDIVVITGHDGILKQRQPGNAAHLNSYKNSHNFVNAVHMARQYEKNKDALTIIAGACQSHFEALLTAGANFASSPGRVLIHALDPLCIASKVAFTPIKDTVNIVDVIGLTHSGLEGMGGIESRGSFRRGVPKMTNAIPR